MRRIIEQFRPQAALQAFHQVFLAARKVKPLQRIERIGLLYVDDRGPGVATLLRRLLHVEIQIIAVLRHGRKTGVERFLQHFLVMPYQNEVVAGKGLCRDDVLPAFQRLPVFGQDGFHPLREITLELAFIRVAHFFHQGLAFGAVLPRFGGHFLYADMDVLRREDRSHLLDDVLEHHIVFLPAHAQNVVDFSLYALDVRIVLADYFRIGYGQGFRMARHVEFGNDFDIACGGISHDLLHFFLRVEAAITLLSRIEGGLQSLVAATPGAYLCQLGIFLDLHAPAVVIGQVPVELVDLMIGQPVDVAQDILLVEERTRDIEHAAAPGETRLVHDFHTGNLTLPDQHGIGTGNAVIHLRRKHLQQGLDGIEFTRFRAGTYQDTARRHADGISFLGERLGPHELDAARPRIPTVSMAVDDAVDVLLEILHVERVSACDADILVEDERILAGNVLHADGFRYEINLCQDWNE